MSPRCPPIIILIIIIIIIIIIVIIFIIIIIIIIIILRSSAWLTVLPLQDLGFNLNNREFRDAVKLRYDWPVEDIPFICACGEAFTVDHSTICKLGVFITQRYNELRDLDAEFLSIVCSDVEIEPVLQDIFGEHLNRGYNKAQDARLEIHACGFWKRHRSAFFDVRVCHPNTIS